MTAHWGIEDPAAVEGTDIQKERAFVTAFRYLKNRISAFTNLPIKSLDKLALNRAIARDRPARRGHPSRAVHDDVILSARRVATA